MLFLILQPISSPLKISIVNYTNTLPFKWALKRSEFLKKIDLQEDIPSICAQKLKFRQVDLALVPVAGQDWFEKDFYATLGVAQDADAAAIKKAYRKLARTLHPDANPGDENAERRFKEVGEAYSVLSDPEQRQQYDAIRTMSRGGARFAPGGGNGGFEDLLGGLFGGSAGAGGQRVRFGTAGGAGTPDLEDLLGGMFGGGSRIVA